MSKPTQRSRSKVIILAMVLLLPGFLYIAVNRLGSNEYVSLPVFGEKKLSGEMKRNWGREYPDTIFHTLSNISFKDVKGNDKAFFEVDTVLTVAHLFYSKDQSFSKLMFNHVNALSDRFKTNPIVSFYSISVDPKESVSTLGSFVKPYKNVEQGNWQVVFQPNVDIFDYAQKQMLIDAMIDPADSSKFLISNQFVLIDSKRRIRGFYDISQKGEVERLEDEIKLQVVEEVRNRPLKIKQK
ncbi:photosynthetic protein synthase I [Sphingobacterium psychroaquaticum]|uniref:photosynthetic protein synthase I n=1 Tax=Sphingobacterium psychroaquaticum TaxID=561061 RepID=UPI0010692CB7|nr:photosynthetic protein synthase I [Sphingobacterium psychroaquaticum]QBQ42448.1 photosynthetic protein synthase I [Sphingobacterium psychroaquaticum]